MDAYQGQERIGLYFTGIGDNDRTAIANFVNMASRL